MKTLKNIGFLFLLTLTAATVMTSCGDETDTPTGPKLTFDPDFTFDDKDALPSENVRIDAIVTSEEKIESVIMSVNDGANETEAFREEGINEKTWTGTISRKANPTTGAVETWTVTVTDKKGNSTSKSIKITTVAESPELTLVSGKVFYNIKGLSHGAYDLVTQASVSESSDNGTKDLVDQTATGGTFSKSWGTLNGSEFIKNPSGVTFEAFKTKKYSDLNAAWESNSSSKASTVTAIADGDLIIVKSGQTTANKLFIVRVVTVMDDGASKNEDSYTFDILGVF